MYIFQFFQSHPVQFVAWMALAWFITGLSLSLTLKQRKKTSAKSNSGRKNPNETEIYVGNLSYNVDDTELYNLFEKFGEVTNSRVIKNGHNGRSKGFGFIVMPNRDESAKAIRALDGRSHKSRDLVVNEAKTKSRH